MIHKHGITWVIIFAVMLLMFLQLPPMVAKQDSVVHTYSALVEVDALAKQQFVDVLDDDRLVDGAIRGMMLQLDPYSGYIAPEELPAFERRNRGEFIGVGVELGVQNGQITVIAPVEGSPAARAGVLPGDVLIAVNGRSLEGRSVFDVEEMLNGEPGSHVALTLRHVGQVDAGELAIRRGPVHLKTVRGFRRGADGNWDYLIDPHGPIGYIRVSNFRENTIADFDAALRELLDDGVHALILDLRFNPGGLMQQAIAMVDRFLAGGLIVSTATRHRAMGQYFATAEGTVTRVKLVILINGSSASAAEIVAGSLQARRRALVIGERSFGKGSVQHLIRLQGHRAAVKLTVAYYRLPDGRTIHRTERNAHTDAWGVIPDIEVRLSDEQRQAIQACRLALDTAPTDLPAEAPPTGEILQDPQLLRALSTAGDFVAPPAVGRDHGPP